MRITLEDGRTLKVETQTGCAGAVTASAFDADPDVFWRQGNRRVKIPANAMIEARTPRFPGPRAVFAPQRPNG